MNFSRQGSENRVYPSGFPQNLRSGDHELLSCAQQHRPAARQSPRPDFWSLKVGENRDRLFVLDGGRPQQRDAFRVLLVRAVRKIEPRHVHPRVHQAVNHPRRTARRPDRAHYFGMTKTHTLFCGNYSQLLLFFTGRQFTTTVFFQSSRFAASLPYRATANSAMTRDNTSTPLVKDASGIRSSFPCIRRKSSSVSGNGRNP